MRASSSLLIDLLICLRFLTRIPFPALAAETAPQSLSGFSRALRMVPAAGALLGALSAGALVSASALGLPPLLAAPLAIAVLAALSGAMHEDGLADCADGFGGGATRERKLEIMADSRIGAFGAVALALALYIRIAAVASIAAHSLALAVTALIGAAAVSRAAALIPLAVLPPARTKGAGFFRRAPAILRLGCRRGSRRPLRRRPAHRGRRSFKVGAGLRGLRWSGFCVQRSRAAADRRPNRRRRRRHATDLRSPVLPHLRRDLLAIAGDHSPAR
ncbi:adenosylcobinamide-GDP ribazoletransferase [Methylocella tundrae]|uniref:adenosylcobinamide-GDP ribazoletransferase n=1 Tax=Methylocella tundrae TaxID=227605 RepID=UPI001FCECCAE